MTKEDALFSIYAEAAMQQIPIPSKEGLAAAISCALTTLTEIEGRLIDDGKIEIRMVGTGRRSVRIPSVSDEWTPVSKRGRGYRQPERLQTTQRPLDARDADDRRCNCCRRWFTPAHKFIYTCKPCKILQADREAKGIDQRTDGDFLYI